VPTVLQGTRARIIPVDKHAWRCWEDIADLFTADRAAEGWTEDRERLDDSPADPWPPP
jgi:hypothetical protein